MGTGDNLTKRVNIKLGQTGQLLVAGAFANIFVPPVKSVECSCGQSYENCICGFSAHANSLDTLRYRPLASPIATVNLKDNLRQSGGYLKPYFLALTQQIVSIKIPAYCYLCAKAAQTHEEPVGLAKTLQDTLLPVCEKHNPLFDLEQLKKILPLPILYSSKSYAHWAIINSRPQNSRKLFCKCKQISLLTTSHYLTYYLQNILSISYQADDDQKAHCIICGALWLHQTKQGLAIKISN